MASSSSSRSGSRGAGVWDLAGALSALCARVVRRRAEGRGRGADDGNEEEQGHEEDGKHGQHEEQDEHDAPVEVTPESVVEMLGAPVHPGAQVAGRAGRPGVAVGLCRTAAGGGEAARMPVAAAVTLTGRLGEAAQESARTALSWLRANDRRYGSGPDLYRDSDLHLHVQSAAGQGEGGPRPGSPWAAALVSAFTRRPLRGGIAMTGELTLSGQVLPVGGIAEKVLAAHRCGLARVILPERNRKQVDEDLDDELRRAVAVDLRDAGGRAARLGAAAAAAGGGRCGPAGRPGVLSPARRVVGQRSMPGRPPCHGIGSSGTTVQGRGRRPWTCFTSGRR